MCIQENYYLIHSQCSELIQDYCILYGNSLEDLTIQSFFNFGVQKFTRLRLVTTMCDTLACFLGLNNLTPLADYHLMKGNYYINFYFF